MYMCSTHGIPASVDSFEWSIRGNLFTFIRDERGSRNLAHFLRLLIGYWKYLQLTRYVRINSISRSHPCPFVSKELITIFTCAISNRSFIELEK